MNHKATKLFATIALLSLAVCAFGQNPEDPEEMRKFDEAIEKSVEHYEETLNLEDWQSFYMDSILRHDYTAMREEVMELNKSKVSNSDLYVQAQDKWAEAMYNGIHAILNEEQWAKYLKSGAAREKKARDKRAAKLSGK